MPLTGKVEAAPNANHGFDCNQKLTTKSAADLKAAGFSFVVRYLTRGATPPAGDLTTAEANDILNAGLALMAVQHVAKSGWTPSVALGASYGANAVNHAQQVGLPPGVNVFLDLEDVDQSVKAKTVIDYCNAWFEKVEAAGYTTGVYIGAGCRLSGDDIFWRLKTKHYWRSGSKVPEIPQRGYQMIQRIIPHDKVAGVEIDRNLTRTDNFGDNVQWLRR